jgi:hypothetical protein
MNSIKQIDYEAESPEVPEPFASLIQDADERWEKFWAQKLNKRYPRYVASEPAQVYAALKHVRDEGLALGERFIEWGSGFGVATSLAAQLGFEATGIELEDGLVRLPNRSPRSIRQVPNSSPPLISLKATSATTTWAAATSCPTKVLATKPNHPATMGWTSA